ncbi:unnamed protein product, partial [Ectocarpus sp. 12 AP-2014]
SLLPSPLFASRAKLRSSPLILCRDTRVDGGQHTGTQQRRGATGRQRQRRPGQRKGKPLKVENEQDRDGHTRGGGSCR